MHVAKCTDVSGLRERKKQQTREQIAAAGLELFGSRGYHATTVADVAAAAEVSERTVYTYFPTKEDILFADHADLQRRLGETLAARTAGASALDTLREFVVENLSLIDEASRTRWEIVSHDEHLLSHQRARQSELCGVVAEAVASELGGEADDFRVQLVNAAVGAAITAVYEHRTGVRSQTASRAQALAVVDEAIAFLRGGLDAIRAFPKPY